jgi:tetratricopeptide (TPR) repeat protein
VRALLLRAEAHALRGLGRYVEAIRAYRSASRTFERAGDRPEAARCAIGWIDALMYLGRYDEAWKIGHRALADFRRARARSAAGRLLNNLANLEYRRDRALPALRVYARARAALGTGATLDARGRIDANRGNCFALRGRPREAGAMFRSARRAFVRAGRGRDAAACDYALASLLFSQHRYFDALSALSALDGAYARLEANDFRILLEIDAAEIYLRLARPAEAILAAERARSLAAAAGLRYEGAKATYFEAVGHAARGDLADARPLLVRARRAFESERNPIWAGQCQIALAECDLASDRKGPAARRAERAARSLSRAGDPERAGLAWLLVGRARRRDHARSAKALRSARACLRAAPGRSPFLRFRIACLEGDLAFGRGDVARARRTYRRAIGISESVASRIRAELFRATDWSAWQDAYPQWIASELRTGRVEPLFHAVERGRAHAFELATRGERRRTGGRGEAALEERLRALACRLETRSFGRSPGRASGAPEVEPALHEQRAIARELERLDRARWTRRTPAATSTATVAELRSALRPGERLVEYFLTRDDVGAVEIDAAGATVHARLAGIDELREGLEELRFLARMGARAGEDASRGIEEVLRSLAGTLVPPSLRGDAGAALEHVVLVPAGAMVGLPWPALVDAPISVLPSAAAWLAPRAPHAPRSAARTSVLLVGLGDRDLPEVTREIEDLAALLPSARVLLGEDATVARMRGALEGVDWLHIAGHGRHDEDRPILSGVRLHDRWAHVLDLTSGRRAPRVVVLAACRTAELDGGVQNDWQGLAGGMLRAGTTSVLASLWDVDDRATRSMSASIYRALASGRTLADAVRVAPRSLHPTSADRWNASTWSLLGRGDVRLPLRDGAAPSLRRASGARIETPQRPHLRRVS